MTIIRTFKIRHRGRKVRRQLAELAEVRDLLIGFDRAPGGLSVRVSGPVSGVCQFDRLLEPWR